MAFSYIRVIKGNKVKSIGIKETRNNRMRKRTRNLGLLPGLAIVSSVILNVI